MPDLAWWQWMCILWLPVALLFGWVWSRMCRKMGVHEPDEHRTGDGGI